MTEKEKVVQKLEEVIAEAVYPDRPRKFMMPLELAEDALALLKAQEPVKPVPDTSYGARPWWFVCGNCKLSVNEDQKYCSNCGRAVKWG